MDNFFLFVLIGFFAQIVDGTLGMAYGVLSNSFLLSLGVTPVVASSNVHFSELFTSGLSAFWHFRFGNIDRELVSKLIIPGSIGGVAGAYVLVSFPSENIKFFVASYLVVMGIRIIWKAFAKNQFKESLKYITPLAFTGGFSDSVGGGGWGPIVTSTIIAQGKNPRLAVGSVNLSEFFVTLVQSFSFLILLSTFNWNIAGGLLIGGMIASPIGAYLTKRINHRLFMIFIGILVILLSIRTLIIWSGI